MPTRPPRACIKCQAAHTNAGNYCSACEPPNETGYRRRPMEALYHTAAYKLRFQPTMKRNNPICQRIIDGERCHNPSVVLHHLNEPKDTAEFYNPKNIAMLCQSHHPGGRAGTPEWVEGRDYAPTQYKVMGMDAATS